VALIGEIVLAAVSEALHIGEPLALVVLVDALLAQGGQDHVGAAERSFSVRIGGAVESLEVAVLALGGGRVSPLVDHSDWLELEVVLQLRVDWSDGRGVVERPNVGRRVDQHELGMVVLADSVLQGDEQSGYWRVSQSFDVLVVWLFDLGLLGRLGDFTHEWLSVVGLAA
jgi:hypothetical protein